MVKFRGIFWQKKCVRGWLLVREYETFWLKLKRWTNFWMVSAISKTFQNLTMSANEQTIAKLSTTISLIFASFLAQKKESVRGRWLLCGD